MNLRKTAAAGCALLLLTACGDPSSSISEQMQYIKTSVMYDTIYDMYQNPDSYLGGIYHMVGTLYPGTEGDEKFYSVYAEDPQSGHGIGIELDWDNYDGISDYDRITVEGKLDKQKSIHEGEETEILILRVSMLEKRAD
ncbi:MAG: hypothetical protein K6E36_05990 [Oscillospiraceae bacterium]|nr:hypothetical protein [Oscillospiraceae bacterium]